MSESADDMITYIKISHRLYKKKQKGSTGKVRIEILTFAVHL